MTTQETITKLIEKYSEEIHKISKHISETGLEQSYFNGKEVAYAKFISDLKELQNNL